MNKVCINFSGTIPDMIKFLNETLTEEAQSKASVTLSLSVSEDNEYFSETDHLIRLAKKHFIDNRSSKLETLRFIREATHMSLQEAKVFFETHVKASEDTRGVDVREM